MIRLMLLLCVFMGALEFNAYGKDIAPVILANPTVRAAKAGQNSAAYGTIKNNSTQELRLVKASTPHADQVELHRSFSEDGIHKMRPVDHIIIPAGGEVVLAPGGLHIMLLRLQYDLVEDQASPQAIPIALTFNSGETIEGLFLVEKNLVPCH